MRKVQRTAIVSDDLLYTKLTPPHPTADAVSRASLLARLDAGLVRKLTLIVAPPGFGKTTLVSAWAATRSEPVAWISLDAADNDPVRFWRYVFTACSVFGQQLGRSALAALRTAQQPSLTALLTPFINDLAQLPPLNLLILEDYHTITAREVNESVAFLLDHLPPTLHMVMLARSEPALPVARLRARNELTELTSTDLRFSQEEIQAFLQQTLQVSPSPAMLKQLEERTEGWAAGLRLITLALRDRSAAQSAEELLATFSGGHRYVLEYLSGEVIATQSAALQEFLLQTSVLNRLTGSLCEAVTGRTDSALLLTQLERANLFLIPLGDDGHYVWYRYHALFAEALRTYARQRLGDRSVSTLIENAGRWYEAHGLIEEAIEAALATPDFERASVLIEQAIEQRDLNELFTLGRWAAQLPEDVLHAHPSLCFNYAVVLLFTSDRYAPATMARLEGPLHAAAEAWGRENNEARLGRVLALRSTAALWQGDRTHAFAYARESLELLPEHDVFWRGVSLLNVGIEEVLNGRIDSAQQLFIETRALCGAAQNIHGVLAATFLLGETCAWRGEFDQASQLYHQVLAEAIGGEEMLDDQASAGLGLALIAYERDELDAAEQQATRARDLSERRSNEEELVHASVLLARILTARGQAAQAQDVLRALTARVQRPLLLQELLLWQTRLAFVSGDVETARHWAEAHRQRRDVPHVQQEQAALLLARVQVIDHKPEAAVKLLEPWRVDARQNGRVRSELEILCVQSLAYANQADKARAYKTLTQALTLAQPKGYRRIFLDEGEPLAQLLQAVVPDLGKRPIATYAAVLLRALASTRSGQPGPSVSSPLLEPLSAQEQRVLRLLAAGLSNPEIARELVVSPNTIKTQVQSIYRKLNVNSRDEAAEMARRLKLV